MPHHNPLGPLLTDVNEIFSILVIIVYDGFFLIQMFLRYNMCVVEFLVSASFFMKGFCCGVFYIIHYMSGLG